MKRPNKLGEGQYHSVRHQRVKQIRIDIRNQSDRTKNGLEQGVQVQYCNYHKVHLLIMLECQRIEQTIECAFLFKAVLYLENRAFLVYNHINISAFKRCAF